MNTDLPCRSLLLLPALLFSVILGAQPPIGMWRDHFPYQQARVVTEGGGRAWCATEQGIFSYDMASGEIERYSKVNALSDVGISTMRYNQQMGMLVVGYANGNLDLVRSDRTINLSDIRRANILGEKRIGHIRFEGQLAYLGCGFGVVVVDLGQQEVRETWFIGDNGAQVQVNATSILGDSIYCATPEGLYSAWRNSVNLADFNNWRKRTDMTQADGPFTHMTTVGDKLLLNYRGSADAGDTLFVLQNGSWSPFAPLNGVFNQALESSQNNDYVAVTHQYNLHLYDVDLNEVGFYSGYGGIPSFPRQGVVSQNGYLWVADERAGLVRATGGEGGQIFAPNGPKNASVYRMASSGGVLYVATGAVSGNWGNSFSKDGVHHLQEGVWRTTDRENSPLMLGLNTFGEAVNDVVAVAVDPSDANHAFAGSWDDGLLEFRDRQLVQIYDHENSTLQQDLNVEKVNVGGMSFDREGNLWMTNANTAAPLAVRTPTNSWRSYDAPASLNNNTLVGDIIAASSGHKWVLLPRGRGILVFNDNGTLSDISDDEYKVLDNFEGSGNLPSKDVYSIAEDLNGEIWVGTISGVAVFYSPGAVFSGGNFDAQQILIEQDGNVQILLETEAVTAIAVDGANRKWIGTESSGVFLISADGREQLQRFTVDNSPLPSNTISSITIDGVTGEVFFGTSQGIVSYRSDASAGDFEATCAKVFPNPVKDHHTGPVAITGLVRDSDVRITDISGNLVYSTTSLGGQAIWPATDMGGNRVATGVYLIFASDREGNAKCNTKVLVVR